MSLSESAVRQTRVVAAGGWALRAPGLGVLPKDRAPAGRGPGRMPRL